eukprot:528804-Rhodomonas_salina.2
MPWLPSTLFLSPLTLTMPLRMLAGRTLSGPAHTADPSQRPRTFSLTRCDWAFPQREQHAGWCWPCCFFLCPGRKKENVSVSAGSWPSTAGENKARTAINPPALTQTACWRATAGCR